VVDQALADMRLGSDIGDLGGLQALIGKYLEAA